MFRRLSAPLFIIIFLLTNVTLAPAAPLKAPLFQDAALPVGMTSTAAVTDAPGDMPMSAVQDVTPIRLTTAKSLREQDFSPIIETSLFTTNDYSAYAYIDIQTGASSITMKIRWRWYQPDGTSFDTISPWWNFGSEGKAAAWLELKAGSPQTGRWQVKYYAQVTEGGSWQYFGENIFFINPGLTCTQLGSNGGFESGSLGWQKSANTLIGTSKPHWGTQSAREGAENSGSYSLYQDVTLPAATQGELALAYYMNVSTDESGTYAYDFLTIQIRDTAGNVLETLDSVSNMNYFAYYDLDVWQPLTWDLSAYAGRTVRIWTQAQTDGSLPTTWFLDDFSVSKCTTSATFGVRVILAEPSDESHDSKFDRAYYENLLQSIRSYHIENSMGRVVLNLAEIYDNGGKWYKLTKTHKAYAASPLDFVREAEQAALGTTTIPRDTILVAVHAGDAAQTHNGSHDYISTQTWEAPNSPNGNEVIVSEHDALGGWAHEIGHDLGSLLVNSVTPDLYRMGEVGKWDLMADGSWNGGWLCNSLGACDGSNPAHMSSYTKVFLQFLNYQRVDHGTSGSYWIDVLPRQELGDNVLQYVLTQQDDGTPDKYYVIETRNSSNKYSKWDTSLPDSGLVLYWVDARGHPMRGTYDNNIQTSINQVALLKTPGLFKTSEYFDADNMLKFKVSQDSAQGTSYSMKLDISTPAPDPIWLAGVILKPDGKVAGDVAAWQPIAAPPLSPQPEPDLDLHVYTDDGRHVGMNYVTGEYEVQVDGAVTSGNLLNAHEWILLPQGIGFHYVVRSASTYQFLQDNPGAQAFTDGMDGYQVYGLVSNPSTGFSTSSIQSAEIASGADLEHAVTVSGQTSIQVGAATATSLPVDLTVLASGPGVILPGEQITYHLTFGNSGGSPSTGVNLMVHMPSDADLVSAPGFTSIGNNEYRYSVPSMDIGGRLEVVFVVRAHADLTMGTPLVLLATISDDGTHGTDNVLENNEDYVTSFTGGKVFLPLLIKGDD